ncbi:MAG: hypothetical protein DDG59_03980 [Anaerolineae bacterium]|jgi:lipid II:glycine glycyltransferase (peptidoglycan interpeptide bridge formation enzyme)|nr:MAG: hypothetical protein DDG59_03980 [Anaerolineae bacterium]
MSFRKDYLQWERFLAQHPQAHLLQSSAWGKFKEQFGWDVYHLIDQEWGAQVLVKNVFGILRFAYIPKGPVGGQDRLADWLTQQNQEAFSHSILAQLRAFCHQQQVAFVKVEPDILLENQMDSQDCPVGFEISSHAIQPLRTILIDIKAEETEILARMKQKTRYNIRLAERKGVVVRAAKDIDLFYQMMQTTGHRDGFAVHSYAYYEKVYRSFSELGQSELLIAYYRDTPIAGLMVFCQGERAFYFYGASRDEHREVMAPYLLQWNAILWAKKRGCTLYDLWGVPDYDEAELEQHFEQRKGGLWGVYRFKRGFGGRVVRYAGPYDFVNSRWLYWLYRLYFKRRELLL